MGVDLLMNELVFVVIVVELELLIVVEFGFLVIEVMMVFEIVIGIDRV